MNRSAPLPGSEIHAETKLRDAPFVMTGHHCHSCIELFYVESGDCRFLIDDHIQDLRAGDFILVPPMALHYTRYVFGPCKRTVVLFRMEDVPEDVRRSMPRSGQIFTETTVFHVPEAYRGPVCRCLRQMAAEDKNRDDRSPLLLRTYLQELLLLCGRLCLFPSEQPGDIHTSDQQILQAARYISAYYMNPITTADVARAVGFSPNYLTRRFREAAGIGLYEYIVFVRLHHAAQELLSTADSITDIALRCGFSDSNYFKDSFKKKYGVTPRNYRKTSQGSLSRLSFSAPEKNGILALDNP